MENLVNVLMNTEEIEEDGVCPKNKKNLYPLHQLMTDILIRKIQPLHTNTKLLLLSSVVVVVVDQLEDVGGSVAGMVHYVWYRVQEYTWSSSYLPSDTARGVRW